MATNYIWDFATDSYLMEKDDGGNTTAVYTTEPAQYGKLVSQRRGNTTSYYHFDAQSSTRQLTDGSGDVTDSYTYSAFGEIVATSGATVNAFLYGGSVGYSLVSQLSASYVRRRVLLSAVGRWMSLDGAGFVDGMNRYGYAMMNPVSRLDPSGNRVGHGGTTCAGRPVTRFPGHREVGRTATERELGPGPTFRFPSYTPLPPKYPGQGETSIGPVPGTPEWEDYAKRQLKWYEQRYGRQRSILDSPRFEFKKCKLIGSGGCVQRDKKTNIGKKKCTYSCPEQIEKWITCPADVTKEPMCDGWDGTEVEIWVP
jgi:RHS repeat-associated protein